jgi:hypothetical protein
MLAEEFRQSFDLRSEVQLSQECVMNKTWTALAFAIVAITAGAARANTVAFGPPTFRDPMQCESCAQANPVPQGSTVWTFTVTTDSDILAFENIKIEPLVGSGAMYHNPFGDPANANKPNPALIPAFPTLADDSWFDTPGTTSRLGADLPGDGFTTFGDLDNDGPQNNFVFAQLTLPPTFIQGLMTGRIAINSTTSPGTPYSQDFRIVFPIPEPASASLCGIAALALAAVRRRSVTAAATLYLA